MIPHVTVAICTQGKNDNIFQMIPVLLLLKKMDFCYLDILVVLNSTTIDFKFSEDVSIAREPVTGYASVRNKALQTIKPESGIIFIDDDEIPTQEWLESLLKMHQLFPGDVIVGPVFPSQDSEEFDLSYRRQFVSSYKAQEDASLVRQGPTANMFIPREVLESVDVYFDTHYNSSGSEDTDLCFRLRKQGIHIRFAKDAAIFENEKPDRFNEEYLVKRYIRDVSNYSVVIRRSGGIAFIVYRFVSLTIRVWVLQFLRVLNRGDKVKLIAFQQSLTCLISGETKNL